MRRKGEQGGPRRRGRVLSAVAIGLALGLLASLVAFSSREHSQVSLLRRRSDNLAARFAEQVRAGPPTPRQCWGRR